MATGGSPAITAAFSAQAISSAGSAYTSAEAARAQGQYQKEIANLNARTADIQAEDVVKRGEAAASKRQQDITAQENTQKAAIAAQGGDVNSQAADVILTDTARVGAADINAIKTNAWREAFGLKEQATNLRNEGLTQERASKNLARNTMISGGLESLSYGLRSYGAASSEPASKSKGKA